MSLFGVSSVGLARNKKIMKKLDFLENEKIKILKYNGFGKKVHVVLDGNVYYIPVKSEKYFREVMYKIKLLKESQYVSNNELTISGNPWFNNLFNSNHSTRIPGSSVDSYVGSILPKGYSKKVSELNEDKIVEKLDSNLLCVGKIVAPRGVIMLEQNTDEVVYNMPTPRKHTSIKQGFNSDLKEKFLKIVKTRKPKNLEKIKKNFLKASVAVALSVVSAVSVYVISKMLNQDTYVDNVIEQTSTVSQADIKLDFDNKFTNSLTDNSLFSKNEEDKPLSSKIDVSQSKTSDTTKYSLNNDEVKKEKSNSFVLGQKIQVKNGSKIYSSAEMVDSFNPFYEYNEERTIYGIAYKCDNSIVFCTSDDEIKLMESENREVVAICSTVNGSMYAEGFYKSDDVVAVVNESEHVKVLKR